jgi:hypothetical protein
VANDVATTPGGRNLAAAVQELLWGGAKELIGDGKQQEEISGATGGYVRQGKNCRN